MNSVKDYSLKRAFSHTQSQSGTPSSLKELECMTLAHSQSMALCPAASEHLTDALPAPLSKRQRLQSLTDFPNEILAAIQSLLIHPLDLLHFSQACVLFRTLTDEKAWHRLYMILVPVWSTGAQVGHLRDGAKFWRQVVIDDFLRRIAHWVIKPDTTDTGDIVRSLDGASQPLRLGINLELAAHVEPPHMRLSPSAPSAGSSRWRNVGAPASHTELEMHVTVSAYMQARSYGDHIDHQIVIYRLPNHETPLAVIPSDFWAHSSALDLDAGSLGVAQLMDIKQFPNERDDLGRMRMMLVVAFGESNLAPLDAADGEAQFLDVWMMNKIIEIFVCDTPQTSESTSQDLMRPRLIPYRADPVRGKVDIIAPRSPQELIRGRAVKLYRTLHPLTGRPQDNIALFGIHQDVKQQAIVITSPLSVSSLEEGGRNIPLDPPPTSHSSYVLGGDMESSCMALYPPQSDFEHLIVIMDRNGRGEIWNWQLITKVAELQVGEDDINPESYRHRKDLYYWGVQVNWAIEEPGVYNEQDSAMPFAMGVDHREHGDFRIVALADGQAKEWETCWWQVSEQKLREQDLSEQDLRERQRIEPFQSDKSVTPWVIQSSSRHFEASTLGKPFPSTVATNNNCRGSATDTEESLLFIAYLVWDHYRIALTSQYSLCVFDMDQELTTDLIAEEVQETSQPQWVTLIENSVDDPLIDIATVGDCLFLTRKYSHMMWPFRKHIERQPC